MSQQMKNVMISSTALDLPEHREQVKDACISQGMLPKMMEHLPALDADAIAASIKLVDEADIYIGIFAHRYGYVPKENNPRQISITEMEYNRAVERNIPRLIFIIHKKHPLNEDDFEMDGGAIEKLKAFKGHIQVERVRDTFISPEDLRGKVLHALVSYAKSEAPTTPPDKKYYPDNFPSVTRFFTGRENVLDGLQEKLKEKCRASLHGISGLGKTSVALEYAKIHEAGYDKIFFVRATKNELVTNLSEIAQELMPELKEVAEVETKAKGFAAWLRENKGWLAIYDNVEDFEGLKDFVPNTENGHFIFTANSEKIKGFADEVKIKLPEDEEAKELLYRRAKQNKDAQIESANEEDRKAIVEIVEELGRLPLAINIAGAYIAEEKISFAEYLSEYRQTAAAMLEEDDEFSEYQHKSVARAFTLAYDKMRDSEGVAGNEELTARAVEVLLKSLVFLSPDAIPEKLFNKILSAHGEDFTPIAEDKKLWRQIRKKLTQYDLLEYDVETETFETHRLVQRVVENKLDDEEKKGLLQKNIDALKELFPKVEHTTWAECAKYALHIETAVKCTQKLNLENDDVAFLCNQVGYYFYNVAQYQRAEYFYERALEIREKVLGAEHPDTATSLNNLAALYRSQGRYEEALPLLERALAIFQKVLGDNHPNTKTVAENLLICKEAMKNKG